MKWKTLIFLSVLFSSLSLHAGSLRLLNDTKFELTARIMGSDGTDLGEVTVPAGATLDWSDTVGQKGYTGGGKGGGLNKSNKSMTPYTVFWITSKTQEEYSACFAVHTGTTVSAKSCRKR